MKKFLFSILILSSLFTATAAHEPLTLKELTLQTVLANFTAEQIKPCITGFDSVATSKILKKMQMAAILHYDFEKRDLAHAENLGAEKVALLKEHDLWNIEISIQDLYDNSATRHLLVVNHPVAGDLDLSDRFISSLEGLGTIPGINTVQSIDFNNNQITTLAAGVFNNLPELYRLNLSNNQITTIAADVFSNLPRLVSLYLGNNQITIVAAGAFNNLPELKKLCFANNQITTVVSGAFSNLPQLRSMNFSDNRLTTFSTDAFINVRPSDLICFENKFNDSPFASKKGLKRLGLLSLAGLSALKYNGIPKEASISFVTFTLLMIIVTMIDDFRSSIEAQRQALCNSVPAGFNVYLSEN